MEVWGSFKSLLERDMETRGIPHTAVWGSFKSFRDESRWSKDLNHPPTAVGDLRVVFVARFRKDLTCATARTV